MTSRERLLDDLHKAVERVLISHPEFDRDGGLTSLENGWVVAIRRYRKPYGTFADTDQLRLVQRDLVTTLRRYGFQAQIGSERNDWFTVKVAAPDHTGTQETLAYR